MYLLLTTCICCTFIGFQKRVLYLLAEMREMLNTHPAPAGSAATAFVINQATDLSEFGELEQSLEDDNFEMFVVSIIYCVEKS